VRRHRPASATKELLHQKNAPSHISFFIGELKIKLKRHFDTIKVLEAESTL
jgi:hypothetical protein